MATRITATELARNLSDILNRVRYKGETFEIERNGVMLAEIKPAARKRATLSDLVDFLENGPKPDPDFARDVEEAHRLMNEPLREPPAWDC